MDKLVLNLRLFDGDGAAAGTGEGTAAAGADAPEQPAEPKKGKNPFADVRYGKQAEADGATGSPPEDGKGPETVVTSDAAEARKAEFEQMIKGEYKDLFDERAHQMLNARFKETKALEAKLEAMRPITDALASKYGVDPADGEKLLKSIEEDESYYEDEAEREGITVEQLKSLRKMATENERLRTLLQARDEQEGRERAFQRFEQQSVQCAQVYPGFDFEKECQGPAGELFTGMLRSGVDVKTAYEVVHKDELLGGAIQYAVQATQKRMTDNIKARGMRPAENGAGGNAPAQVVKSDPSKWTRADRDEVERRVMRGERIEL